MTKAGNNNIKEKRAKKENIGYWCLLSVLLFALFFIYMRSIGAYQRIHVLEDEFGYWGVASWLSGFDWADMLANNKFYNYGYSLVLVPIMLGVKAGFYTMNQAYQIAIFLNVLMLAMSFVLSIKVLSRLFPEMNRYLRAGVSFLVTCYPGYTTQVGTAWTEIVILFVFWCVVYFTILTVEKGMLRHAMALVILTAFLFAIHMRSIALVAGFFGILLLKLVLEKQYKKASVLLAVMVVCGALLGGMYLYTKEVIFAGTVGADANDFSGQTKKVQSLISFEGIMDIILSVFGKIYYLGVATFGLLPVIIFCWLREIWVAFVSSVKEKKVMFSTENWQRVFLVTAVLGVVLVNAVFQLFRYYSAGKVDCLPDKVIYGRYMDFVIGPVLAIGILDLCRAKWKKTDVAAAAVLMAIATIITQKCWNILSFYAVEETPLRETAIPGASYLFSGNTDKLAFVGLFWCACGFALWGIMYYCYQTKSKLRSLCLLLLFSISILSVFYGRDKNLTWRVSKAERELSVEKLMDLIECLEKEDQVIYVSGGEEIHSDMKRLQWELADRTIPIVMSDAFEPGKEKTLYIVSSLNAELMARMSEKFYYVLDTKQVAVFANFRDSEFDEVVKKELFRGNMRETAIDLSKAIAGGGVYKIDDVIYLPYENAETYMTGMLPYELEDGIYKMRVEIKFNPYTDDCKVGYIHASDINGNSFVERELLREDFDEEGMGVFVFEMPIWNFAEPVIEIFAYAGSNLEIHSMSYQQMEKHLSADCVTEEEWDEIAKLLTRAYREQKGNIWYVDTDLSAQKGFIDFTSVNEKLPEDIAGYIPVTMLEHRENIKNSYLVVEKYGEYAWLSKQMVVGETENYLLLWVEP